MRTIATGMLLISVRALAIDVPVEITGTIQIPPCQVNGGDRIVVDFGNVSVVDVTNEGNRREVDVPFKCSNVQGTAYVKITGFKLGGYDNVLATGVKNFGIALYQGRGTATKLILGDGKYNGQNSIGYPIKTGVSGKENGIFTFTAVPFKEGNKDLMGGRFSASANMSITYF